MNYLFPAIIRGPLLKGMGNSENRSKNLAGLLTNL